MLGRTLPEPNHSPQNTPELDLVRPRRRRTAALPDTANGCFFADIDPGMKWQFALLLTPGSNQVTAAGFREKPFHRFLRCASETVETVSLASASVHRAEAEC